MTLYILKNQFIFKVILKGTLNHYVNGKPVYFALNNNNSSYYLHKAYYGPSFSLKYLLYIITYLILIVTL